MKMLRTTLACLVAIAVPAVAQTAGPRSPRAPQTNRLERTLTEILKRLDRLEKRIDAKASTPAKPVAVRGDIVGGRSLWIAPRLQMGKQHAVLVRSNPIKHIAGKQSVGSDAKNKKRVEKLIDFMRTFDRDESHAHHDRRGHGRDMHCRDDRHREHRRDHTRQCPHGWCPHEWRPHEQRPDDRRHRRSGGPRGHKMRGDRPLGKLAGVLQAARKGDPRARQMLTRLRSAINEILGEGAAKNSTPLTFGFTSAPKTDAAVKFRLRGPDGRVVQLDTGAVADVNVVDLDAGFTETLKLLKHAQEQHVRVERLTKSNAVRAMKMREARMITLKKKAAVVEQKRAAKMKKKRAGAASQQLRELRAEMARLQAELAHLKRELQRK